MSKKQTVLRTGLGTLFIGAGIIQATHREFFTALIPEQIAEHGDQVQGAATVTLTGIGASFLIPPLNPIARWAATIRCGIVVRSATVLAKRATLSPKKWRISAGSTPAAPAMARTDAPS